MNDRNAIRAALFNQTPRVEIVSFAGITLEIRQPPVGEILSDKDNTQDMVTRMLVDYCYVPGTDEKVFSAADAEAIRAMPFNADWTNLTAKINALTGINVALENAKGN